MRKIFVQEMVSVDGFFARENGDLDWHNVDAEFNEYAIAMLNSVDTIIFGHTTYEMMAGYWSSADVVKDDPIVEGKMNSLSKIVFSKSLEKADWNNTKVIPSIDPKEIMKMKEGAGKDIVILGSGTIVAQLTDLGLIDEYRLIIAPVLLGKGKSLFTGMQLATKKLKLAKTQAFKSGNVLLCYQPA